MTAPSHTTSPVWTTVSVLEQKAGPPPTQLQQQGKVFFPPVNEVYSYDFDGNLTQDGRWNYTWDGENRLVTATNAGASLAGNAAWLVQHKE